MCERKTRDSGNSRLYNDDQELWENWKVISKKNSDIIFVDRRKKEAFRRRGIIKHLWNSTLYTPILRLRLRPLCMFSVKREVITQ